MSNPGRVYSAEEIYERVWESDAYAVENTVMVHISRIREKLEINPKKPEYLRVVWGLDMSLKRRNGIACCLLLLAAICWTFGYRMVQSGSGKAVLWQRPTLLQKLQLILPAYRLPLLPNTYPMKQLLRTRPWRRRMAAISSLDSCFALCPPRPQVSPLLVSGKLRRFSDLMASACLQPLNAQHMTRCKMWNTFCGLLPF